MMTRKTGVASRAVAVALLGVAGIITSPIVSAQSNSEITELRNQMEALQKEVVVGGDIPGSFRMPGSQTSIRVYGFAETHVIHDLGYVNTSDVFTEIGSQPTETTTSTPNKGQTRFSAGNARFGFETSTPTAAGAFTTKVEGDFYAYGNAQSTGTFRLRQAYGEYAGWLVGQTWSTWMDLDNTPETVDFTGPVGGGFARLPMVRYAYDKPQVAKFTVALESSPNNNNGSSQAQGAKAPTVVLRADKSFDGGSFNIRAVSAEIQTADLKASKSASGVGFGFNYKITDNDLFMAQVNQVMGDDGSWRFQVGANGVIRTDEVGTTPASIILDKSTGAMFGWAHTFSDKLRGTFVYSQTDMNESDDYKKAASYAYNKKLTQYHINMIYSPIKNIELGAEYVGGERTKVIDAEGTTEKGKLSRIDLMGKYYF